MIIVKYPRIVNVNESKELYRKLYQNHDLPWKPWKQTLINLSFEYNENILNIDNYLEYHLEAILGFIKD